MNNARTILENMLRVALFVIKLFLQDILEKNVMSKMWQNHVLELSMSFIHLTCLVFWYFSSSIYNLFSLCLLVKRKFFFRKLHFLWSLHFICLSLLSIIQKITPDLPANTFNYQIKRTYRFSIEWLDCLEHIKGIIATKSNNLSNFAYFWQRPQKLPTS